MNRKEFGELVAALRQDMGWTQFQLSEYSDVDHAVIAGFGVFARKPA